MNHATMRVECFRPDIYLDYSSFKGLGNDPIALERLIALYRRIFAEPDGWAEDYSYSEVYDNLRHELSGHAHLRLNVDVDNGDDVLAFCWAQLLSLSRICQAITTVQHYHSIGQPDIYSPLSQIMGDGPVIYLHDLGVRRDLRGKLSLSKLIYPVLHGVAERSGVHRVLFWTIENTHVSQLARRAGFELVLLHSGMQFYIGRVRV